MSDVSPVGFVASSAFAVLAFKGFTTITNSGAEIVDPHRNVGRTIMIAIAICVVTYLLVAIAVGSSLSIREIVASRDYSLAAAAEPALGNYGFYFTIVLALVATSSGVIASVFAVSRMLTMLTEMKLIPHSHFGMSGPIRRHLLVYTVLLCALGFDALLLGALGAAKLRSDPSVVAFAVIGIAIVFLAEYLWLRKISANERTPN